MSGPEQQLAWHADPERRRRILLVTLVIVATLIADLWSKSWAWEELRSGKPVTVIENVFYLKFGFNTGLAFSFLRDASWSRTFFIGVTMMALGYMAWLTHKMPTERRYGFVAVGMIAGGAMGNLHDRFVRQMELGMNGEIVTRYGVVDFLQFYYNYDDGKYWPIFNIADVALVAGVLLLLIYIRYHGDDGAPATDAESTAEPAATA